MLRFYWSVGEDIERRKYENRYGSHFYENVSRDLRHVLGLKRGLSPTTIKYTHYFYCLYNQVLENRQQGVDEFEMLFLVPWSHHTRIIDKVSNPPYELMVNSE